MKSATKFLTLMCITVAFNTHALAGPLNPPAGPIASTNKTLQEVEPRIAINVINTPGDANSQYRINQPGSYYLTGNIAGFPGTNGIKISTGDVTIDLNGFAIVGIALSLDGIIADDSAGPLRNITIRNGTVRAWGGHGVNLSSEFDDVANSRVEGIVASGNAGGGIEVPYGSTISNCTATENGSDGLQAGITTGESCTLLNCTATRTNGDGIRAGIGCSLLNCAAADNVEIGLEVAFGSSLTNCSSKNNLIGVKVATGSSLQNCASTDNTFDGFLADRGVTITNCSANFNGAAGFSVQSGCVIVACSARTNGNSGAAGVSGNTIKDCSFFLNGGSGSGAGIRITGSDNRIEGNNCVGASRGIEVTFAGNFIVRNICTDNTVNWSIVTGNFVGPIVVASGNAAAINGNSYAGGLGSTDPNANFTY